MEDFPGGPILKPPGIAPVMHEMERLCLGVGLIWGMEFHQPLYFFIIVIAVIPSKASEAVKPCLLLCLYFSFLSVLQR